MILSAFHDISTGFPRPRLWALKVLFIDVFFFFESSRHALPEWHFVILFQHLLVFSFPLNAVLFLGVLASHLHLFRFLCGIQLLFQLYVVLTAGQHFATWGLLLFVLSCIIVNVSFYHSLSLSFAISTLFSLSGEMVAYLLTCLFFCCGWMICQLFYNLDSSAGFDITYPLLVFKFYFEPSKNKRYLMHAVNKIHLRFRG